MNFRLLLVYMCHNHKLQLKYDKGSNKTKDFVDPMKSVWYYLHLLKNITSIS